MSVYVDRSDPSFVGVCSCGYRCLTFNHRAALVVLAAHELSVHSAPRHRHARDALRAWDARHADSTSIVRHRVQAFVS